MDSIKRLTYTGCPKKDATLEKKPSLEGLKSILMHELA